MYDDQLMNLDPRPQPSMRRVPPGGPPIAIGVADHDPEDRKRLLEHLKQLARIAMRKFLPEHRLH